MAQFIDRAALWSFTAASCLLLMLTLTDGNLLISIPAAFLLVVLLRLLVRKLPEKRFIRRRDRIGYINSLLEKWTLMDANAAIAEIKSLIPNLLSDGEWQSLVLIQQHPSGEALNVNRLIEIWRAHKDSKELLLLATCPADASAVSIVAALSTPSVRLIDGKQLSRRLLRVIRSIPVQETKKERRKPFSACFAHFSGSVRPIHTAVYLILFGFLYSLTKSILYLIAALAFALLLSVWIIERIRVRCS